MALEKTIFIRRLNGFSWAIIIAFIGSSFAMQYHTNSSFYEFFDIVPLIILAIYWCEKSASAINLNEHHLKNKKIFNRDLFLLSFSFFLGFLLSLCFAYNNSDAKSWWTLFIYFMTIYSLIFSFIFSLLALLIKNHKVYTLIFSLLIILLASFGNFLPHYGTLPLIGKIDTFYLITCSLLIVHCLLAIIYRIIVVFSNL
ncbi:MAG: hypothetical protein ACO1N3_00675 [Gammaproteobacteria bacterium]